MPGFCPNCGSELQENATFCGNCGASVPAGSAAGYVRLDRPLPEGMWITADGEYQWEAERPVWGILPFFKILHIVCAVFAVLICVLIFAFETEDDIGTAILYSIIALVIMGLIDLSVSLCAAARRAFRFRAVFTLGHDSISAVEAFVEGKNGVETAVQIAADLASRGDVNYGFCTDYASVKELISSPDKTKIKVKASGCGGFLLTTPEQHDFVVAVIRDHMKDTGA